MFGGDIQRVVERELDVQVDRLLIRGLAANIDDVLVAGDLDVVFGRLAFAPLAVDPQAGSGCHPDIDSAGGVAYVERGGRKLWGIQRQSRENR